MSENKINTDSAQENTTTPLNPDAWTTGTEPISEKQAAELKELSGESSPAIGEDLSAAGAHIQIEALKKEQEKG